MNRDEKVRARGKKLKALIKYKVGNVVRIIADYYVTGTRKDQGFQQIVHVESWVASSGNSTPDQCLTFANGDRCHSKYVRPLLKKEWFVK